MNIFLKHHMLKYPLMQTQDKIKLIYQASLGPTHFANQKEDINKIYKNILKEMKVAKKDKPSKFLPYYEMISESYIRINLLNEFNPKYLASSFYNSINDSTYDINILKDNLRLYLTPDEYENYDFSPIHHSKIYSQEYYPHYRIINTKYLTTIMRIYQLQLFLENTKEHSIIALEGKCASGKSTIAKQFEDEYTILHADDFFLPNNMKTKERIDEIGGNINYELIKITLEEIKEAWENSKTKILIKAYSCKDNSFYEKEIKLKNKIIFEGVYSYHPYFNNLIDKCAFLYVNSETQINRIMKRNNSTNFINTWMPLENKYYDTFDILSKADIII